MKAQSRKEKLAKLKAESKHLADIETFKELMLQFRNPEISQREQTAIYRELEKLLWSSISNEEAAELGWNS